MTATPGRPDYLVGVTATRAMKNADRVERARRLEAELLALEVFDHERRRLGHDYGAGQRARELARVERDLGFARKLARLPAGGEPPSDEEVRQAFERIAAPRERRIAREDYRRSTPSTKRTISAWRLARLRVSVREGA